MSRVEVTRCMVGICGMQVCAESDASDEEILAECNAQNPSGTRNGWSEVVRVADETSLFKGPNAVPVKCIDHPERTHFLVLC